MNRIKGVLLTICLSLNQQHLFCDAVGGVGLFRIPVPEIIFSEGNRRELWIRTDSPNPDELFHAEAPSVFHQHRTHDDVLINEPTGVRAVRAYSANDCSEVNY